MKLSDLPLIDLSNKERAWALVAVAASGAALWLFDAARAAYAEGNLPAAVGIALVAALCGGIAYWTTIPDAPSPEGPASRPPESG